MEPPSRSVERRLSIQKDARIASLERELAEARAEAEWVRRNITDRQNRELRVASDMKQQRDRLAGALDVIGNGTRAKPVNMGVPDATLIVVAQDEYEHLRNLARAALAGGEAT